VARHPLCNGTRVKPAVWHRASSIGDGPHGTYPIYWLGYLDIHKERISVAVAESGRSGAVEYLGEIANDPSAISKLCDRLRLPKRRARISAFVHWRTGVIQAA
jgi:hypothetical protein